MKARIISLIITLFGLIAITVGLSFAWYTYKMQTATIDASTGGISMTYTINSSDEINLETYEIENVVFFDVDRGSSYELVKATGTAKSGYVYYSVSESGSGTTYSKTTNYKKASGTAVSGYTYYSKNGDTYTLETVTVGTTDVSSFYYISSYTFDENDEGSFYLTKETVTAGSTDVSSFYYLKTSNYGESKYLTSSATLITLHITNANDNAVDITVTAGATSDNPYLYCVASTSSLNSSSSNTSVTKYLTDNSLTNTITASSVASGTVTNVYLYIYGVQPDDTSNNDFLDDTYQFTINIVATNT